MDWLWDVLFWIAIVYAMCGAIAFALLFALWIFTIVVVIVSSILSGRPTAPDWLEDLWDGFGAWFF
jgi:hypothetical protein